MGRLEAQVESLELKWSNYRDELKKLVNRLEKREERAEKKLRETSNSDENHTILDQNFDEIDEVSQRVLARRLRHGVPEQS